MKHGANTPKIKTPHKLEVLLEKVYEYLGQQNDEEAKELQIEIDEFMEDL